MSEYNIDNGKTAITVLHGSAYTVVRATQQVNGKWQFWGVSIDKIKHHGKHNQAKNLNRQLITKDFLCRLIRVFCCIS